MAKYLSRRVIRTPQSRLTPDRYQYLGLNQAEPNLGDPPGDISPPIGVQYILVSIDTEPGGRYWIPLPAGIVDKGITVRDEGTIVGTANSITQLNFVGPGVQVTGYSTEGLGIATVSITAANFVSEPTDAQTRYIGFTTQRAGGVLTSFDLAPSSLVFIPSTQRLGIGSTTPNYGVDVGVTTIRISGDIANRSGDVGAFPKVLTSLGPGAGFTWANATGPLGPQGPQGFQGFQGAPGPSNVVNATNTTTGSTYYPVFVSSAGVDATPRVRASSPAFQFNAATGELTLAGQLTLTTNPFFRNTPTIASNYTITSTYNEMSIGPVTINSGITVTVDTGGNWTVI